MQHSNPSLNNKRIRNQGKSNRDGEGSESILIEKGNQFKQKILNYLECMQIYSHKHIRALNLNQDFLNSTPKKNIFQDQESFQISGRKSQQQKKRKKKLNRQPVTDSYLLIENQQAHIQSKYADNYEKSHSERRQIADYTFQQIQEQRNRQEEDKNINCWQEFKKWICCEGGVYFSQLEPKQKSQNRSHAYISQDTNVQLMIQKRNAQQNIFNEPQLQDQFDRNTTSNRNLDYPSSKQREQRTNQQKSSGRDKTQRQKIEQIKQQQEEEEVVEPIKFERYALNRGGMLKEFGEVQDIEIQDLDGQPTEPPVKRVKGKKVQNEKDLDRINYGDKVGESKEQKKVQDGKKGKTKGRYDEDDDKKEADVGYKLNERRVKKGKGRQLNADAYMSLQMRKNDPKLRQETEKVDDVEFYNFHKSTHIDKKRNQRSVSDYTDFKEQAAIYEGKNDDQQLKHPKIKTHRVREDEQNNRKRAKRTGTRKERRNKREQEGIETLNIQEELN